MQFPFLPPCGPKGPLVNCLHLFHLEPAGSLSPDSMAGEGGWEMEESSDGSSSKRIQSLE